MARNTPAPAGTDPAARAAARAAARRALHDVVQQALTYATARNDLDAAGRGPARVRRQLQGAELQHFAALDAALAALLATPRWTREFAALARSRRTKEAP